MTTNPLDCAMESPVEPLYIYGDIEEKADMHDNICYGSVAPTTTNPLDNDVNAPIYSDIDDTEDMQDNSGYGVVPMTTNPQDYDVNAPIYSDIDDTEDMQDNSGYGVVPITTNPQDYDVDSPIEPLYSGIHETEDMQDNVGYGSVVPMTTNSLDCSVDMGVDRNTGVLLQGHGSHDLSSPVDVNAVYSSTDDTLDSHDPYDYVVYK